MQAPISSDLGFDPFAPSYLHDPYPAYPRLREQPPFYAPAIDMWVLARYADVDAVFRDPERFSAAIAQDPLTPLCDEARAVLAQGLRPSKVMSNLDPPEHRRIRAHTTRAFSARRIAVLEPTIRRRAAAFIDAFAGEAEVDVVRALTFPLPAITIFTMIGFPDDDLEQLKAWCGDRLAMTWGRPAPQEQVRVARQMVAYWSYCTAFVARRDAERADDFTSDLLNSADEARGHVAFGMGIHYCLGAALARLQVAIVLELMSRHFPRLRLVEHAYAFHPNISFRGPHELRLALGTAG